MKNIKYELFTFKKNLKFEESDISTIVESHLNSLNMKSEKKVILSLTERLEGYMYNSDVKAFVESLNEELEKYELTHSLKDLYKELETSNQGQLYRPAMQIILDTINLEADSDKMEKILTELNMYTWIPEVKLFIINLSNSPEDRQNLVNGGKSEPVYTLVESVEKGHLALIKKNWFLITKDGDVTKTLLENHVKDLDRIKLLRSLEHAYSISTIADNKINFILGENLVVGLSVKKPGTILINNEELQKESTLESLFESTIIPIVNKNFYSLILETSKNLGMFVDLDIVKKATNLVKPHMESFIFNIKDKQFVYRCDERHGDSLYKYSTADDLVRDMKNEMNVDLTYFFENKLNKEVVVRKQLEDKERQIFLQLENVNHNLDKLNSSIEIMGNLQPLTEALSRLNNKKDELTLTLESIKVLKYNNAFVEKV